MWTVWFLGFLVAGAVYALVFGHEWETQKQEAIIRKNLLGFYHRTTPIRTGIGKWRIWQQAKQTNQSRQLLWIIGWFSGLLSLVVVDFFIGSLFVAIPIACLAGFGAVVFWIRWNFTRKQALLRDVFLDQAIPLGIQVLGAINDLSALFPIAADSIEFPLIQSFFLNLHQSWRPRGMTPEEAFYEELKKWDIPELTQLGAITLLSMNREVELGNIWLEYHTLITNDLQRRDEAAGKTYGARNSALLFVGMVGLFFLVAAKFAGRWITPTISQSLYIVFGILIGVAWWIWKQKDAIDV